MTYGVKVLTEGRAEVVECDASLGSMRSIIRGCIERVPMSVRGGGHSYWCDKAGRLELKKLPKNTIVSYLAGRVVVGTVLILAVSGEDIIAMSRETAENVCKAINNIAEIEEVKANANCAV